MGRLSVKDQIINLSGHGGQAAPVAWVSCRPTPRWVWPHPSQTSRSAQAADGSASVCVLAVSMSYTGFSSGRSEFPLLIVYVPSVFSGHVSVHLCLFLVIVPCEGFLSMFQLFFASISLFNSPLLELVA